MCLVKLLKKLESRKPKIQITYSPGPGNIVIAKRYNLKTKEYLPPIHIHAFSKEVREEIEKLNSQRNY